MSKDTNVNCTDCKDCTQCDSCNQSSYCNQSSSCNKSSYCDKSSSCNKSSDCNKSFDCDQSSDCNQSYYCNQSSDCNQSYYCDKSSDCNQSYYCDKCANLLYCFKLKFKEFHVFNKPVTETRFDELKDLDYKIYDGYELAITQWIEEKDMTDDEKVNHSKFYVMGGYLKTFDYQDAWKNLWKILPQDRKDMLLSIPEFDSSIFKGITGIDVSVPTPSLKGKTVKVILDGTEYSATIN